TPFPSHEQIIEKIELNLQWVRENISQKDSGLLIPNNFQQTAPNHDELRSHTFHHTYDLSQPFLNPQTVAFTNMLNIENKINSNGQVVEKVSP
ncbi:5401_t:CDS:2, partial [Acaulospora morrowiae]